ncbi:uncharacterized protein SPPG_05188 [Spizellomyces punctatus DAOM BR117]|uniref:Uncharacterized protein n=1 Tax=Spizellomyces punctatus (strain DAOM BR117) TaxID=645134 RepID=A0A0L0HFK7_SPIPD|nr:uncharacterized protein SPPG_05188 [Spizellomyces punctatus DAOM BR117]KNC99811.1 hypothetical protein SPPG_05188 [Spizellomyces punctatus DAOM BR117]|eukprot:XP_016607851.1 hypothetical protein SPPG_05188 [Spizellomyces punctatus DAOM BR117]
MPSILDTTRQSPLLEAKILNTGENTKQGIVQPQQRDMLTAAAIPGSATFEADVVFNDESLKAEPEPDAESVDDPFTSGNDFYLEAMLTPNDLATSLPQTSATPVSTAKPSRPRVLRRHTYSASDAKPSSETDDDNPSSCRRLQKSVSFSASVSVHAHDEWIKQLKGYRKEKKKAGKKEIWRLGSLFGGSL